ncbi:MAG: hypothetical protein JJE07_05480 [Flavobacteriaceae bacterium]|nr:hypothetical protein [Flavobacteriaceae bacterium]
MSNYSYRFPPRREIHSSLEELKNLQEDRFYTISKIHWWLLKYDILYKYCKKNWNNGSCFDELPCSHTLKSNENAFVDFYEDLEEVTELHKKESYFKEQMEGLEMVRDDNPAFMQWLRQNEKLGTEYFIIFWTEWLEEDDIVNPGINIFPNVEVKILAKEFGNTIQFLEVFNELYWAPGLCKEN